MSDLPKAVQESIERITDPGLREAVERAAIAGHNPDRLREAELHQRHAQGRERMQRQDYLLRIADAALSGQFGADAKSAAALALKDGRSWEALERVGRIVDEAKRRGAR